MKYTIKRGSSTVAVVRPKGNQEKKLMGANIVTMGFELPQFIEFLSGDSVEVYGETYYLNVAPSVKEESSIRWVYNLEFQAIPYDLIRSKYFFYDNENNLKEPDFSLTGTADKFLDLLLTNISRTQEGWSIGDVDETQTLTLSFSNDNCLSALSRLAEEFKTEYWIEGKTIHLTKKGDLLPITLAYGKGNGLRKIERVPLDNNPPITRLYVFGSDKNLPADYRNYSKRLKLPFSAAPEYYIENNVDIYGIREDVYINNEIFPRRDGTVTATSAINVITDSSLDFNINDSGILIAGVAARIKFISGQLAGYEFDVRSYNHTTKTITFNQNTDEKDLEVPSELLFPEVGDKWILININMPSSYITAAENELLADGISYLQQNSGSRFNYNITTDPFHFERNNVLLSLGKYISVTSDQFNLDGDIRIVGYTRDIQKPYEYSSVEVSEVTQFSPIVLADSKMRDIIKAAEKAKRLSERVGNMAYQNLVEKAKLGNTLIEGGYLKNDLIETETLIVQNLMTSTTGKRFEILSDENNASFFDTTGKRVIHIDDDQAVSEGTVDGTIELIDNNGNPTWISTYFIGSTQYFRYLVSGPGMSVGYGIKDPGGYSTIGRKKIFTTGKFSTFADNEVKDGITKTFDFGGGKTLIVINGIVVGFTGF